MESAFTSASAVTDHRQKIELYKHILSTAISSNDIVQAKKFIVTVLIIREKLAKLYESEQQWSKAAQVLSGIYLDSRMRVIDDTFRLSKCVQIACLYLEDDGAVNAEAFINKASFLVCYARILDLQRKFLGAA
ncbi:COP9 signalosome complex subunit 4 [Quillaja saponaria]|uniref:COP9 signalosome complex subunit 4 n=1 Tax=Quillaja saponaria TaxID=32244 RepID=A0AAD7PNW0_QUISA|nr:COP9 signalosome complex subunit 4 [Quillaja saponaria]